MYKQLHHIGLLLFLAIFCHEIAICGGLGRIGDKTILKNVKHKILVLEYENPVDNTWGKDISQMMAQEFLGTMQGVFNMGVVHLEQRDDSIVEYTPENILKISMQQEVLITIWGEFYFDSTDIYIYSHLRIISTKDFPKEALGINMKLYRDEKLLIAELPTLQVNFKPIKISIETLEKMHEFYNSSIQIREEPNDSAKIKKTLNPGDTYYVIDRQGDWMKIAKGLKVGWVKYQNLEHQNELKDVKTVLKLGQGILQYMAGKYDISTQTFKQYLIENNEVQDPMNLGFTEILLGNSILYKEDYRAKIPRHENMSAHYIKAHNLLTNHPSPVNHLAIITILRDYIIKEDAYQSFSILEKKLIRVIQTSSNQNAINNLEALYIVSQDYHNLRNYQNKVIYDSLINERLRVLRNIKSVQN